MNVLGSLRSLAHRFFHRSATAAEMEAELFEHIALRADDLERNGLSRADAERRARIEFGGREHYREASFQALGGNFVDTTLGDIRLAPLGDIRLALRVLGKSPGFAIVASLTLALAIGANAVVFGIFDGLVLRPLNVPQSESLYGTSYGDGSGFSSYPDYTDLRARNHSFDDLAAFNFAFVGLDSGNDPIISSGIAVTGNYFDVLRLQPYLGRFFHSADEHGPGSAPYLVLTWSFWHTRFHEDRGIIGRTILINKHPFTVLGVAPPEFHGTLIFMSPDFFLPIVNQPQIGGSSITERGTNDAIFETFGHLKPGVTPAQASADVNAIGESLQKTYPRLVNHHTVTLTRSGLTAFTGAAHAFAGGLAVLAILILLAACANLGSLFAAHAADRSREVALRLALGSTRRRILRQLLTEAIVISLAGTALGLAGSVALLRKLATWQPFPEAPIHIPVSPDARLYAVALLLALVSAFLFGIVPVRQVLRANPYEIVKGAAPNRITRHISLRDLLLVLQIALCAVLVTSSMVAIRGLVRSLHGNYGFDPRNSMLLGANFTAAGYSPDQGLAVQKRLIEAMQSIPGVQQVGAVNGYPPLAYASATHANIFRDETRDYTQHNVAATPFRYEVTPDYFQAAGTSLVAGRDFAWHDDKSAPQVGVTNREFAVRFFGSVNGALGHFLRLHDGTRVQIIGVVEDGKYLSLAETHEPALFLSAAQWPAASDYIVVRSTRNPLELGAAIRSRAQDVDKGLVPDVETWDSLLAVALFPARMASAALGVLGLMGAILSITGIFGMAAYMVSRRLKELGIRVALGARRTEVLRTALGRAVKLLAFGSAAGLVLGILASRVLSYIVYQATPRDPLVLTGVVVAMALVGLVATWIPAQRALAVDPMLLLREE